MSGRDSSQYAFIDCTLITDGSGCIKLHSVSFEKNGTTSSTPVLGDDLGRVTFPGVNSFTSMELSDGLAAGSTITVMAR